MKGILSKGKYFLNKLQQEKARIMKKFDHNSNNDKAQTHQKQTEINQQQQQETEQTQQQFQPQQSQQIESDQILKEQNSFGNLKKLASQLMIVPQQLAQHPWNTDFYLYYKKGSGSISKILREIISEKGSLDFQQQSFIELLNAQLALKHKYLFQDNPIFLIAIVGFHHKRGAEVEFMYPDIACQSYDKEVVEDIKSNLSIYGMPDACHQSTNDYVFFNTHCVPENNRHANHILYGITCFRQIKVTERMKELNPELTRSHMQKSICVLSEVPLFGSIEQKLTPATEAYFQQDDLSDFKIVQSIYDSINQIQRNTLNNIDYSELFMNQQIGHFLTLFNEKILIVWKAILLEKNILIYSQKSSLQSNFTLSLLSLFPGALHFQFVADAIDKAELSLRDYGLPLRFFNSVYKFQQYFTIQQMSEMNLKHGRYFIGTTNQLIKENNRQKMDVVIDLDAQQIQIINESAKQQLSLNSKEKQFMKNIMQNLNDQAAQQQSNIQQYQTQQMNEGDEENDQENVNQEESNNIMNLDNVEYLGSEAWVRNQFYDHLKTMLIEIDALNQNMHVQLECIQKEISSQSSYIQEQNQAGQLRNTELSTEQNDIQNSEDQQQQQRQVNQYQQNNEEKQQEKNIENKQPQQQNNLQNNEEKLKQTNLSETENIIQQTVLSLLNIQRIEDDIAVHNESQFRQHHENKARRIISKEEQEILTERKQIVKYLQNNYNENFLNEWTNTENFKFWIINYDDRSIFAKSRLSNIRYHKQIQFEEKGDIYLGDLLQGVRDGVGTVFERSRKLQMIYTGEFVDGKKEGRGSYYSVNNGQYIYDGEFKANLKHGQGNLVTQDYKYSGGFYKGRFHGEGVFIDKNQNIYSGEYYFNRKQGKGEWQTQDGWEYVGQFKRNRFHGTGKLTNKAGDVYQGEFANNRKNGEGYLLLKNGSTYTGGFKNDLYEGAGVLKLPNGDIFEGVFAKGKLNEDMDCVIKYGCEQEEQKLNFSSDKIVQKVYMGKVKDNAPHGKGILEIVFQDGRKEVHEGEFQNGQLIKNIKESSSLKQENDNEILPQNDETSNSSEAFQIIENLQQINQTKTNQEQ